MLSAGDRAPDFTLPDQDGEQIRLSTLLERGPLILYFYPADFTPGCTKEACALRDLHDDLVGAGLRVIGISPQDSATHRRFRQAHGLPFPLLADTRKEVAGRYGVKGPLGLLVRRATFLIDADATIRDAVLADVNIDRHARFVRQAIEAGATNG